jgi:hypothetical protein
MQAEWAGMTLTVADRLLEHLSPTDVRLVSEAVGRPAEVPAPWIVGAMEHPAVHEAVFASTDAPVSSASPFLVFTVAVHGVADGLAHATLTNEWLGPRTRLPVFDAPTIREFLDDAERRLYLAQLLTSFTRVAGWTRWTLTNRGWRRSHFSELDPVQLAHFATVVSEAERPGVWRRLGDLSLFLTGVFPDHTAERQLTSVAEQRLRRITQLSSDARSGDLPRAVSDLGAVGLIEMVGERAYRSAVNGVPRPLTQSMRVVDDIAARFRIARRVLNLVTERYLFPIRSEYFGVA